MKKTWPLFPYWIMGVALLVIVAGPVIIFAVLKALGLAHGASLPMWLLDYGNHVSGSGAGGGAGAGGAAAASGSHGSGGSGGSGGSNSKDPTTSRSDGRTHPGDYTPTPGYHGNPIDDPAFQAARDQATRNNPGLRGSDGAPPPPSLGGAIYEGVVGGMQKMH